MRSLLWIIRLSIAGLLLSGVVVVSQRALVQLQAELEFQTALISVGIDRIQYAYESTLIRPDKYDYTRVLALGYSSSRYKSQALEKHLLQVKMRPSWPYAWFDLARWHARFGQLDSPLFTEALAASTELGNNESGLRKARARMALAFLDKPLHSEAESLLEEALNREFAVRPGYIFRHSALGGRESIVCSRLNDQAGVGKWCEQMAYYRKVCAQEIAKTKKHRDWCSNMRAMWKSRI